jgi:hypothetical protein
MERKQVNSPEDVINLGWEGSYGKDAWRFEAVNDYIRREPDKLKRQQADVYASTYGMGQPCEIDPDYDPLEAVGDGSLDL